MAGMVHRIIIGRKHGSLSARQCMCLRAAVAHVAAQSQMGILQLGFATDWGTTQA